LRCTMRDNEREATLTSTQTKTLLLLVADHLAMVQKRRHLSFVTAEPDLEPWTATVPCA